jgi:broad specificity phosphatase PhoE
LSQPTAAHSIFGPKANAALRGINDIVSTGGDRDRQTRKDNVSRKGAKGAKLGETPRGFGFDRGKTMSKNIVIFVAAILFLSSPYLADAQQAIFLVRHGETVAPKGTDARPLSEAGQRRAALLATLLKDTGIKAIFTSNLERTIKTAEPLAQALRIESKPLAQLSVQFKQSDVDAFVDILRTEHRGDIVLLVGHANTVPALLKALGYPVEIKIPETEFDNLFVLTPKADGPPTVLRLRY